MLSLSLPITVEDTETATKVVLALAHLIVAAVMIPPVALRLAYASGEQEEPSVSPA